jgi:predicted alpha/beta-hydrolase family hydrolase
VLADLDADGKVDAVLILVHEAGGSGTFFYLVAAVWTPGIVVTRLIYLYTREGCAGCQLKPHCTTAKQRWVSRHFEEDVLNEVAERTEANPMMMRRRRAIVEHLFGTLETANGWRSVPA